MKIIKTEDYVKKENPTPGKTFRSDLITSEDKAKEVGGMFAILAPGTQVPYHYHEKRESIIMLISGEAIEILEGKEIPVKAGDVLFVPAIEKHAIVNRSSKEVRYIEFWTPAPHDFVEVK